jgi:hypothetical protein
MACWCARGSGTREQQRRCHLHSSECSGSSQPHAPVLKAVNCSQTRGIVCARTASQRVRWCSREKTSDWTFSTVQKRPIVGPSRRRRSTAHTQAPCMYDGRTNFTPAAETSPRSCAMGRGKHWRPTSACSGCTVSVQCPAKHSESHRSPCCDTSLANDGVV